ncbi:MAG TPA: EamA family transporter [Bosea sp. (in: a-proteobacteria)]|jgi:O-acetylserine/cysteine efflux transporter|nr:EamA family transporter [Bosea sp. (in: a-proteobacteria)]
MKPRHLLLSLVVVFFWGVNFAIIKLGLRQISPLGLGVIRFVLAAFPWIFFIRRPPIPLPSLALYSLLIFALQFGFLFTGMKVGVSAGLASLVMQLQVFFTIGFAVLFLSERPTRWQLFGALFAFGGIAVVAANLGGDVTLAGLTLLILGAMAWGGGNIVSRVISMRHGAINVLGLVCWGSLLATPPLLAVALILDPQGLTASFTGLDWTSLGAIAYLVYISTLFCFGAWSLLLGLYPVATVAPFTLLVPVFGFLGSAVLLGEAIQPWKLLASALIIAGLVLNVFGQRLFR